MERVPRRLHQLSALARFDEGGEGGGGEGLAGGHPRDESTTPSDMTIDYKVSSFQINLSYGIENKLLPNDLLLLETMEMMLWTLGRSLEAWWTSKGSQAELEAQSKSSSSLLRSPGAARTKINALAVYGVRLDALYMDGKIISSSFQWNWF